MIYYHLRYNVYENSGSAVEKERWIAFHSPLNDTQIREFLEKEHNNVVSVILSKVVSHEEFELAKSGS